MGSLFDDDSAGLSANEAIGDGAVILRRFLGADTDAVVRAIDTIAHAAPFREMATPGGHLMSVEMTNCGAVGWVTDRSGYRYSPTDRLTGNPWPSMPPLFVDLALRAARQAGFDGFLPDCCLINRYSPGARMSLHQARDERKTQRCSTRCQ